MPMLLCKHCEMNNASTGATATVWKLVPKVELATARRVISETGRSCILLGVRPHVNLRTNIFSLSHSDCSKRRDLKLRMVVGTMNTLEVNESDITSSTNRPSGTFTFATFLRTYRYGET